MANEQIATNMRDWSKSRYVRPVRLTQESHAWLKDKKGKKCMAGFLEEIISKYKHGQAKIESI